MIYYKGIPAIPIKYDPISNQVLARRLYAGNNVLITDDIHAFKTERGIREITDNAELGPITTT